ncbi:MAG: hypothetical protein IT168_05760 [Bryobacterales bacterium]|nr:hypothetical protein [Bryobacterales bacterium]
MFFRREKPKVYTFSERMSELRQAGFEVQDGPKTRVSRNGCAAELSDAGGGLVRVEQSGVLVGSEIGLLVDVGYQKTWQTASGKRVAARAEHLKALHAFTEDLRETLGLTSFYNESLGTTNDLHLYDRVEDRDAGVHTKPWEHA